MQPSLEDLLAIAVSSIVEFTDEALLRERARPCTDNVAIEESARRLQRILRNRDRALRAIQRVSDTISE
jgi:hypothetical protein